MRISDWSSDVCSSDLAEDRKDQLVRCPVHVEDRRMRAGRSPLQQGAPPAIGLHRGHVVGHEVEQQAEPVLMQGARQRSAERRVGKESGSTCRSRWQPTHKKKNHSENQMTNEIK